LAVNAQCIMQHPRHKNLYQPQILSRSLSGSFSLPQDHAMI